MSRRRPSNPAAAAVLDEDLLKACTDLLPRLGSLQIEIRYSEPDAGQHGHQKAPVAWLAIARVRHPAAGQFHQVAAAFRPELACYRLLEVLVDGGTCQHCGSPTGITRDLEDMPAASLICWYQYDPELVVFRRSCE